MAESFFGTQADDHFLIGIEPGAEPNGFVLYQSSRKEITALVAAEDGTVYAAGVGLRTAPPPAPPASGQPAAIPAVADAQSNVAGPSPANPVTFNLPPSAIDTNPPGTPSYVISPGDSVGRRSSQIPRPGGTPAF